MRLDVAEPRVTELALDADRRKIRYRAATVRLTGTLSNGTDDLAVS